MLMFSIISQTASNAASPFCLMSEEEEVQLGVRGQDSEVRIRYTLFITNK